MSKLPIENKDGWAKDTISGAIDCTSTSEYDKFMKAYYADKKKEKDFETLQSEVSELKSDMSDIKSLLLTLVQSNQKKDYDD
tara:strand:+ start:6776 stop:7021 length:246 start_codon:yes stop_codon:yes gene_type:complete